MVVATPRPDALAAAPPRPTPPSGVGAGSARSTPEPDTTVAQITPTPAFIAATPLPPPPGEPVTVLIIGIDKRPGEASAAHADSLILARLDPTDGSAALLSLPRDLWVDIPGFGAARINEAYRFGESRRLPGGGAVLTARTVNRLLGLRIDYYVVVDFQGFVALIDALGGVRVDVQRPLYDRHYPTMNYGTMEVFFAAGEQEMDGASALIYSRIRHTDSDFQRIQRQQQVIAAVVARLRERGTLRNLLEVDRLSYALRDYVRTDMPHERALGLIWALRELEPEAVERLVVSPEMVQVGVGSDRFAELPDQDALRALARRLVD
jgi:polyisoprenyl-teichoic acid--peptidoglycan teichoic acid transferase